MNLQLVQSNQAETIIVKSLIQERKNVTMGVGWTQMMHQGYRKNHVIIYSQPLSLQSLLPWSDCKKQNDINGRGYGDEENNNKC